MNKLSRWIIATCCVAIVVAISICVLYVLSGIGSIHGKLTVKLDETSNSYGFSAPGDYGGFEWIVGPEDAPFTVTLFNRANWHVIQTYKHTGTVLSC